MVRPDEFESPTPWFVGSKANGYIFIYQYLTSARHTQKQSKPAAGIPSERKSGTVLTTVTFMTFATGRNVPGRDG